MTIPLIIKMQFLWFFAFVAMTHGSPLITEYEWKYFDYVWKSAEQRNLYLRNGLYNPRNMVPIDVDRSIDGRTFVTIIRSAGVPASLHTISSLRDSSGSLLQPYPNWSWYERKNCHGITSVYRVAIDNCNRMWVLDTGKIDEDFVCPAQLLVFDLFTDKLMFRQLIPDRVARNKNGLGLLITPIVETYGRNCVNATVYMADVEGYGLVISNAYRTFRLESDVFAAEPRNSNFTIAGESFYLPDGLLGMALSPLRYPGQDRYLVFRPLASRSMYAAHTEVLKRSYDANKIKFYRGVDVLSSQAGAQVFSSDGTLFYVLGEETAIGCWHMNNPLKPEYFKIILTDHERLQFASGMKIAKDPLFFPKQDEQLLLLTNRLQKIYTQTLNLDEVNFRILRASVKDLIRGTACDKN